MAIASGVRSPRCWLQINGLTLPAIRSKVCRKSKRAADTFSADLSISLAAQRGMPLATWADLQDTDASIIFATAADASDQQVMMSGRVDKPKLDLGRMTVSVSARDKSALLADTRRNQKFPNQRSSDIATSIASDNGLSPNVIDTTDYAGKLFKDDTNHLVFNRTDYETLNDLAEREGCDWYVDGDNLFFAPKDQSSGAYTAYWSPAPAPGSGVQVGNVLRLDLGCNQTAARPHQIKVKSWHHKQKMLFVGTAQIGGIGDPVVREHHHNGYTQEQVDKLAQSRLKNATRHELNVTATMIGDLSFDVRQQLSLTGTTTIYDQTYDVDSVDFSMGWGEAFTMVLDAKSTRAGRT